MKDYFEHLYTKNKEACLHLLDDCLKKNKKQFVITANPETFMIAKKNDLLHQALLDSRTLMVADGIALVKTSKKYGVSCSKITGVDITYTLLDMANKRKKSIYLFGSKEEVIDKAIQRIEREYPNIKIVGYQNGYVEDKGKVFDNIVKVQPDIVLVALGIPVQENLIYQNLDRFQKGIFVGVGGTLDVLSGSKKRAPKFFQKCNLEWLYRIVTEPKRLKRFYHNNIKFIFQVLFSKRNGEGHDQ